MGPFFAVLGILAAIAFIVVISNIAVVQQSRVTSQLKLIAIPP